jgi:hypothetical protein
VDQAEAKPDRSAPAPIACRLAARRRRIHTSASSTSDANDSRVRPPARHPQPAAAGGEVPASSEGTFASTKVGPASLWPASGRGAHVVSSEGHVAESPSHDSAGSQLGSVDARHTVANREN